MNQPASPGEAFGNAIDEVVDEAERGVMSEESTSGQNQAQDVSSDAIHRRKVDKEEKGGEKKRRKAAEVSDDGTESKRSRSEASPSPATSGVKQPSEVVKTGLKHDDVDGLKLKLEEAPEAVMKVEHDSADDSKVKRVELSDPDEKPDVNPKVESDYDSKFKLEDLPEHKPEPRMYEPRGPIYYHWGRRTRFHRPS
ncbi:uncharacterized protein PG986_013719 [Apiospora aurea]|uniref:Uncharacterized protein n=1 Tax=Apiospora aurea TaxID=335848 RepID=A0ABR1PWF2_9PEZI